MDNINNRLEKLEKSPMIKRDLYSFLEDFAEKLQRTYGGEKDSSLLSIKTWDEWDCYLQAALEKVYGPEEAKK